jgi:predicted nucleic acid-binding protein
MKFWDSSAVVPLLVDEPESATLVPLAQEDGDVVVWWGTFVECASALARRRRDGVLTDDDERVALNLLATLAEAWTEVLPTEAVREGALRLVRIHPLGAADALQLSAGLAWVTGRARHAIFVTRDERQARAAEREGFTVV